MSAIVYLIGAGPGDPGLLTLRGAECLSRCEIVLYDGLCNEQLLRHAPQAAHQCVGKHGQQRIWRQQEIIDEMITQARAGRTVARLKGGDPAVFARTAEEVDALTEAGIRYEIVPGITAALAAGSYAGIPITHREMASAVALVTGHEQPGKSESAIDWPALALFPGTLVIYMGVTTSENWTRWLMEAGKPADTPAAIVRRCSLPDQQTIRCRLDQVADNLSSHNKIRPPVIVILGPVARQAAARNWFDQRPLMGQTILVTRPTEQAEELAAPFRQLGANVLLQPAIEIGPPRDWAAVDRAIEDLAKQDVVIFSSRNGVQFFLNRLLKKGKDGRAFYGCRLACVGSRTADSLADFTLRADIIPADFRAEALAVELADSVNGKRVMVVRASRGRDVLSKSLRSAGAILTEVVAYEHYDVAAPDPGLLKLAQAQKIDWVTFTSSASAENVHRMFGDALQHSKIASLSPITTQTLRKLGYRVDAEANPYTVASLVESVLAAC